ncbi:MAG TPA: ABC transporter permease [Terriglobia bacterium]|nr:ABC transporter permease [Terriglobia bacterium]
MTTLVNDVRYALRMLARNPGFTAVAVLTLALGIGANTAVFTLINALMLRALPVEHPEQLYFLGADPSQGDSSGGFPTGSVNEFSYRTYQQLRERNRAAFEDLATLSSAQVTLRVSGLTPAELPRSAEGCLVSGNFFRVLGLNTVLGRALIPEDDREGAPSSVAVISYHYWTGSLGRDPNAAGKTIEIDGAPFTIVGVAPPEFFGVKLSTRPPDFYLPLGLQPQMMARPSWLKVDNEYWLDVFGRLRPGVNPRQLSAALTGQLQQMFTAQAGTDIGPARRRGISQAYVELVPGGRGLSALRERFSQRIQVLTLLVVLVLVIACLNTANLLLARAAGRQREVAVRLAVGAGRWRLVRQLLTESVLLAGLGGLVGLMLAVWGTMLLTNLVFGATAVLPFALSPDARVLGFTLLVSAVTGIAFGLAPALRSSRVDLNSSLKERAQATGIGARRTGRLASGRLLVSGQVMVSLSLLVVAGLFVRSLRKLEAQDLGFSPEHVLVAGLDLGAAGYKSPQLPELYQRLLARVRALPGVRSAAMANASVLGGNTSVSNISIEGYTAKPEENMDCHRKNVSEDYFLTDGMTLLAGRPIGPQDTQDSPQVAVVDEAFVQRYFPNQNPVGRHFMFGSPFKAPGKEIIGVVKDAKYEGLADKTPPMAFMPIAQSAGPHEPNEYADDLEVSVAGDPAAAAHEVRRAVSEVDRNIVIGSVHPLRELVASDTHDARLVAQLSSFFGVLALLLAAIGLYGVMAYSVLRRTNEIGIRMAIGAVRGDVLWMVLRESLAIVALGIALGVPAALGLARVVSSQLFALSPNDPATLALATLLLVVASALAAYIPARRAAKVDPMVALRYE